MSTASANFRQPSSTWSLAAVVGLGLVVILPWWGNHAILQDFYDYGLVAAGAGRINLGERPYVDFSTPIQCLQLGLAALAERCFGARYLSLAYAQAVLVLAGYMIGVACLRKALGLGTAACVAAAVITASAGQHTIVWHNALGVGWLALVLWLLADPPATGRRRGGVMTAVLAVMWLGGMTKITYQAAALALGMVLVVRLGLIGRWSWRAVTAYGGAFLLCGAVLPVLTEMAWTGADWATWRANVVGLASSRADLLGRAGEWSFYWQTPHDYHAPMYMPFMGAWSVALVLVGAVLVWRERRGASAWQGANAACLVVLAVGAVGCGVILLATNQEIAYMAGAASLAMVAAGVVAAGTGRATRVFLVVASVSLLVPAWISAWKGARALWGPSPLVRTELVSADDLPAEFDYLEGLSITKAMHESLTRLSRYDTAAAREGVRTNDYFFANGTEWLVRAYPEARRPGFPLWLHYGTTFSEATVPRINETLADGRDLQVVISARPWTAWFAGMGPILRARYREEPVGPALIAFRLKPKHVVRLHDPVGFAWTTGFNLFSPAIKVTEGAPLFFRERASEGVTLASMRSHRIELTEGFFRLEGEMVVELPRWSQARTAEVRMQVFGREGGTDVVVWEETIAVTADERFVARRFAVSPGGNPVALQATFPDGVEVIAGWRKMATPHSGEASAQCPGPFDSSLQPRTVTGEWRRGLFGENQEMGRPVYAFGQEFQFEQRNEAPQLFTHLAAEMWVPVAAGESRVSARFGLRESAWTQEDALPGVTVLVVYQKAGRLQILFHRDLRPKTELDARRELDISASLPEPGGWVGLIARPVEGFDNSWGHAWWREVRLN